MRRKKRSITLLEIMIAILIIGLIGGVLGYQMKGSLDEGKAFKSREGSSKLESILNLQIAFQDWDPSKLESRKGSYVDEQYLKGCLESSGMIKDVSKMVVDGWGRPYNIKYQGQQIVVRSTSLEAYERAKKSKINRANGIEQKKENEQIIEEE